MNKTETLTFTESTWGEGKASKANSINNTNKYKVYWKVVRGKGSWECYQGEGRKGYDSVNGVARVELIEKAI